MSTVTFGFTAQQIVDEGRTTWENINLLKSWLKTENLPKITDEQFVFFLLSCNNEQEPTKTTIKAHFHYKNRCPEIFDNRNIQSEDLQKQLNTVEICFVPQRTDDGCLVAFGRLNDTYYKNFDQVPIMKMLYMNLEAGIHEHPPTGFITVLDMKGVGIMHLTRIRLGFLKIFMDFIQEGLPIKIQRIHVFNTIYFIDKLLHIFKPLMKSHVFDMITFHQGDLDMNLFFEKWLPKKCLPCDYGGDLPPLRTLHERNIEQMKSLQSYYDQEQLQRRNID